MIGRLAPPRVVRDTCALLQPGPPQLHPPGNVRVGRNVEVDGTGRRPPGEYSTTLAWYPRWFSHQSGTLAAPPRQASTDTKVVPASS